MKMRRLNGGGIKGKFQAHALFVFILTFGAFVRIASEDEMDANTLMFAMILAIGIVIALSLFNQFMVGLFCDLNRKWTIMNYLIPGFFLGIVIVVLGIPAELVDIALLVVLFSIANLVMYYKTKMPEDAPKKLIT